MYPKSNLILLKASLFDALSQNVDVNAYFMGKYNLNSNNEWLPTSVLIDCLDEIEERIGPSTLSRIGSNIAKNAVLPSSQNTFQYFLKFILNDTYRANHQKLDDGFKFDFEDNNIILNLKNNPYPLTFNKGLLLGFSYKHNTLSKVIELDRHTLLIENIM